MDIIKAILIQVFPNGSMYLTATALSAWIIVATGAIRMYWKEWMTYRNQPDTDINNLNLVIITFIVAYLAVLVGLIETSQLSNGTAVWNAFVLANSTAFSTNGIYTIIKHSIIPWVKS